MGMPTLADNLEAYVTKRKWGCTCGVCAGGWLSKRMRFRLEVRAGSCRDVMSEDIGHSGFKRGVAHTDSMVLSEIDYVPSHLHQSVFKTFYVGYQSVFAIILAFLTATDLPLSKDMLQGVISQRILGAEGVTFFSNKGGKIEHALDSITDQAREQSPLGDSSFEEFHADAEDYVPLPTCNNDLEFALVRRMLGLDPELRRGRYHGERTDYGKEVSEYEHLLDDGDYMTGNSTVISLSRLMDISRRIREGHPF